MAAEFPKPNGRPRRSYYDIFQDVLTEERYKRVIERVVEGAEGGNLRAAKLVIEHAQGTPVQRIEVYAPQDESLERLQKLLADAGQPVEWQVLTTEENAL